MNPAILSLIATLIGALAAISGSLIAHNLQSRRERKHWLRAKREEAYSNSIKYLLSTLNRRTVVFTHGVGKVDEFKELLNDLNEAHYWIISLTIYCSENERTKIAEVSKNLTEAMAKFVGHGLPDFTPEKAFLSLGGVVVMIASAYETIIGSAREDLSKIDF